MPTRVRLPDGNIAEFPDGMSPQQIEAALRQHHATPTRIGGRASAPGTTSVSGTDRPPAPPPSAARQRGYQQAQNEARNRRQNPATGTSSRNAVLGGGFLQTVLRTVPGLDELNDFAQAAAMTLGQDFMDDVRGGGGQTNAQSSGRRFTDNWERVRGYGQGEVDALNEAHPVAGTMAAQVLGLAAQLFPFGGATQGGNALVQAAAPEAATRGQQVLNYLRQVPGRAARNGVTGAAYGEASGLGSEGTVEERLNAGNRGAVLGGGIGAVLPEAVAGVAGARQALSASAARRAAEPPTPQRILLNEGVSLTPGQMAGGVIQRLEDAATSIPLSGDMIRAAQQRALEDFNRAATNRSLAPIGEALPPGTAAGHDAVTYAGDRLSAGYREALPQGMVGLDEGYAQAVNAMAPDVATLTPASQRQLQTILRERLESRLGEGGVMSGETYQQVVSELRNEARRFAGSTDRDQQVLSGVLDDYANAIEGAAGRQDPAFGERIGNLNAGWANLTRLEDAAASAGARDGVFTAPQYSRAVRRGDSRVRHRGYARGEALGQDLADAGSAVLPRTVNDSGTATRSLFTMNLPGLATNALTALPTALAYNPAAIGALNFMARRTSPAAVQRLIAAGLSPAEILQLTGPAPSALAVIADQSQAR